jgi:hypothetical protein
VLKSTDDVGPDPRRGLDEAAAEGYRLLSADTGDFAEVAATVAEETWPAWDAGTAEDLPHQLISAHDR